jgi:rare lipoprotein A
MVFAKWSSTKKFKMKSKIISSVRLLGLGHEHKKNNLKTVSKKSILLFLLIAFVALASSQNINTDKQKTVIQKDTVKKSKILLMQQEMAPDSLFIVNGNFKFYKKAAHASYYADKFHGKKTASGKKYNKNQYTAAHKKLPFGTIVKVTNEANGKSVTVEITDRGPFVRTREIDLSKRAFMDIANNKSSGAMKVTIEVLQK